MLSRAGRACPARVRRERVSHSGVENGAGGAGCRRAKRYGLSRRFGRREFSGGYRVGLFDERAVGKNRPFAGAIDFDGRAVLVDHDKIEGRAFGAVFLVRSEAVGQLVKTLANLCHGKRRAVLAEKLDFEGSVLGSRRGALFHP